MDLARLKELAAIHRAMDYADDASVQRANDAADEIGTIFRESLKVDKKSVLSLLRDEDLALWASYAAASSGQIDQTETDQCLAIIERVAQGDDIDAMGAEYWLREYHSAP